MSILQYTKTSFTSPSQLGDFGIRYEGLAVGYNLMLPEGIEVFKYTVPAGNYVELEDLNISFNTPVFSTGIATATLSNAGTIYIRQGSTDKFEARLHSAMLQANTVGADEYNNAVLGQQNRFNLGDGITFTSADTINITVTPAAANTGNMFKCTIHGNLGSTPEIRTSYLVPNATTAHQTILTYNPASDFTLLSVQIDVVQFGSSIINGGHLSLNGATIYEFGQINQSGQGPNFRAGDSTFSKGVLSLGLTGIQLNQGDVLQLYVHPACNNGSYSTAQLSGTATAYSGGGGGGGEHSYTFIG